MILKTIFLLIKIIKQNNPDIVHLHSAKAGFLGRIACRYTNKKSIFMPHGLSYLSFTGFKRIFYLLLEVICKRFTDIIIAVANSEKNKLIFELGFDPDDSNVNQSPLKSNKQIKIGTISRLTYQKNPLLFVEIANNIIKQYKNAEFYILGAGLEDHLKDKTVELIEFYGIDNNFKILNWASKKESELFLESLDIFLLTSIFEGLPLSLLEAMDLSKPCVTSKCDGCIDVIQNNVNGYACITANEFTSAIISLIENESDFKRISMNAKVYVKENHNLKNSINLLQKIYERN
jgi:glycosyltransferase involved in cell wall biosynthesis